MGRWGSKWGDKWGCSPEFLEYQELCRVYRWKQLDHASNFKALCEVMVETFSNIDTKIREMGERIGLDQALGDELDQWGAMVDQPRLGASDDLYRKAIKAKARASFADGSIDDFWDVALLIQPEVIFNILEVFPACIRLYLGNLTEQEQLILFQLIDSVVGLGICKQFVELPDGGQLFEWSYLESAPGDPRVLYPVDRHWDYHPENDIAPSHKAGFAFLIG